MSIKKSKPSSAFFSTNTPLVCLLVLGFLLRLFQLGEWSFWHDEALTVLLARKPLADLIQITSTDVHPPLYFMVVKLLMLLGQSEVWVRLPSALCSTGAILFTYLIGRDLFDKRTGWTSALIMMLAPLQLYYAQEARMYAQLLLLTLVCAWCFGRALHNKRTLWWILLTLGAALAAYTSYFIFPILFAMAVYVLLKRRECIFRFSLSMAGVILLYLPWMGVLFSQTQAVLRAYWMERPHPLTLFTTLGMFFTGYSLPALWSAVSMVMTLFVLLVVANSIRYTLKEDATDKDAVFWIVLWALLPLLGVYAISLVRPIFQARTVLTISPALYLFVGWGLTRAVRSKVHMALFVPTLAMMLLSAWNLYFDPIYAKPSWREAAQYVNAHAQSGDVALHTSEGSFLTFLCYEHDIEHILLPEDPTAAAGNAPSQAIIAAVGSPPKPMEQAVGGYERAFLVVGLDHAIAHQLEQKQRMDDRYALLEERDINGIYVLTYALE